MILLSSIVELLASFEELFIAFMVLNTLWGAKKRYRSLLPDILLSISGIGIVLFLNNFALFSYFTIIIVALYLSITACFLYKTDIIAIFSVISFYLLCMGCFEFLILTIISLFYGGTEILEHFLTEPGPTRIIFIIIIKSLWGILYLYLHHLIKKLPSATRNYSVLLITSIVGFLGFIFLSEQAVKVFYPAMPIAWFIMICILATIVFGIYFFHMRKEEQKNYQILEMRAQLLNDNYASLNEVYMNNSKVYHDLDNHLNVLYHLLDDGKTVEAQSYIQEISKPILQLSKTSWTGIDVVDVVINSKLQRMNDLGITPNINVEFPPDTSILPNDLCTILANLLDNAIEATQKTNGKKYIDLTIRKIHYFIFIRVTNPCTDAINTSSIPTTTKSEKTLHGWGLRNVSEAVTKYNGTIEFNTENNTFMVKIMISFDTVNPDS